MLIEIKRHGNGDNGVMVIWSPEYVNISVTRGLNFAVDIFGVT